MYNANLIDIMSQNDCLYFSQRIETALLSQDDNLKQHIINNARRAIAFELSEKIMDYRSVEDDITTSTLKVKVHLLTPQDLYKLLYKAYVAGMHDIRGLGHAFKSEDEEIEGEK